MRKKKYRHVFSVPCYGDSPYLEELIRSLLRQSLRAHIILVSAGDSAFLRELSARFGLPLYLREGKPCLRDDWNFAYEKGAELAELVTIAHQDDLYDPDYLKAVLHAFSLYPDMSLFFCDCRTIDASGNVFSRRAEAVKRFLRLRLRNHERADRRSVKLSALRFGNGIICPSCCYRPSLCGTPLFQNSYRFIIDWDTFLRLSRRPGRFLSLEKPLLSYRVHGGAETARQIESHNREKEEEEEFRKLHGAFLAGILMLFYRRAYSAYGKDKKK